MASPSKKTGPNTVFNGLVADCEGLAQDAYGVSHWIHLACSYVVAQRGQRSKLQMTWRKKIMPFCEEQKLQKDRLS